MDTILPSEEENKLVDLFQRTSGENTLKPEAAICHGAVVVMIKYQSSALRSFPNYQFHLLHYITFVEQKVMIHLGDCQVIFFPMISYSPFPLLSPSLCFNTFWLVFSSSFLMLNFEWCHWRWIISASWWESFWVHLCNLPQPPVFQWGNSFTDIFIAVVVHTRAAVTVGEKGYTCSDYWLHTVSRVHFWMSFSLRNGLDIGNLQ